MTQQSTVEERKKRFRNKFQEMERDANDFLKYKCNAEMRPRYVIVKEYGLKGFEDFMESEIQLAEQKAREDEREKVLKEFIEWGRNPHKNPFISTPTEDN